mgnify:FL=1
MLVKNRSPPSDSGLVSGMDQTKSLKKVSVDDAFDDPDYDPFDSQSRREGPKSKSLEPATENTEQDSEIIDSQVTSDTDVQMDSGEQETESIVVDTDAMDDEDVPDVSKGKSEPSEEVVMSVDDALSQEDIEALFDE